MKKTTAKKTVAKKAAPKAAAKKPAVKKAAPKAATKKAPAKGCACKGSAKGGKKCGGKKECSCQKAGLPKGTCLGSLISEVFSQLEDNENISNLMKDYFFTEMIKRDIDENIANTLANKLNVTIQSFEADIGFEEDE